MNSNTEIVEGVLELATSLMNEMKWRHGQSLFNALHTLNPKMAEKIRATKFDPFYNDKNILDFLAEIKRLNSITGDERSVAK